MEERKMSERKSNRLETITFEKNRAGRKVLVPFFTACYPDRDKFVELLLAAQEAGADLIEIGLPFSDPIADGRYIQHSSDWVLERGFSLKSFLEFMPEFKKEIKVPLVFMSYLNPVYRFGFKAFADKLAEHEIDGVIFADLPCEELEFLDGIFRAAGISVILMVAPNTSFPRMKQIVLASEGFIYLVSRYGVTGPGEKFDPNLEEKVSQIKSITSKPVYSGFGIYKPEQAAWLARKVDGIIVGSALIKIMMGREKDFKTEEISGFLLELKKATGEI